MKATILGIFKFGPSKVCAPAEQLKQTTILGILLVLLLFLVPLFKTPEGVFVGFQIFAWTPNY
jgi:hypothetical protein